MSEAFCLPVTPHHERFVAEPRTSVYELARLETLRTYFDKHYVAQKSRTVDIGGVVYRTTVYVPTDVDDSAYAIVDASGVPNEASLSYKRAYDLLQAYWLRAKERLRFGDSLSSNYRTHLGDEFVPPDFRVTEASHNDTPSNLSWLELRNYARIVILGQPGTGKTTCLRMLAVSAATDDIPATRTRIPVYIPIRELRPGVSLMDRVAHEIGLEVHGPAFLEVTSSGRLLIILDGLDEVDATFAATLSSQILEIGRQFPDVGLAVGTRDSTYQSRFPGFLHVRINPFSQSQRGEWVQRRIGRTSRTAAETFNRMLSNTPALDERTATPLMLSLAAVVFEGSGSLPLHTSDLVLRYVDAVVDRWDAERGVMRWKHRPFESRLTVRVLCRTAFHSTWSKNPIFSHGTFGGWEDEWADRVPPDEFLSYVWKGSNLLQPKDRDTWQFQSSAVRDVLCAKYLVERTDDILRIAPLSDRVEEFLPVWRYACEISQDASPLVQAMLRVKAPVETVASFVSSILVEDIGLTALVQKEAHDFLRKFFAGLSERLTLLESTQGGERLRWIIGTKLSQERRVLENCADILTTFATRGVETKRHSLVAELKDDQNWMSQFLLPAIIEASTGNKTVRVIGDTVSIETEH